jgi:hypothetical protein
MSGVIYENKNFLNDEINRVDIQTNFYEKLDLIYIKLYKYSKKTIPR